jgi:hypothetical protein
MYFIGFFYGKFNPAPMNSQGLPITQTENEHDLANKHLIALYLKEKRNAPTDLA